MGDILCLVLKQKWPDLIDKECKLMEANNFSKIPRLTLKVKTSPHYLCGYVVLLIGT